MDVSGKRPGKAPVHHRRLFAHERIGDHQGTSGNISLRHEAGMPATPTDTSELSQYAVKALEGRLACPFAHHGMIAIGPSLSKAK
jgi:ribulose-5-phosphate 4-epimerase/fuculose-1-phosphate aldolase